MLEKVDRINLLLDIYGDLLSIQQREVITFYFVNDYSLGEIADYFQVSRQAVHDKIKRAVELLEKFEEKLGSYKSYCFRKDRLNEAMKILSYARNLSEEQRERLRKILEDLYEENEQGSPPACRS